MPEVAFVMSRGQPYALRELATTLQHELDAQAVPSSLHLGGFPEPRPSLVYVLLDPQAYVFREGDRALPADPLLRRTVFLCGEPPPSAADRDHIALLRKAGAVFALDQPSVVAMRRVDIMARLIKPGYSKSLNRFDATASRPIDVMFAGTHSLRRTKYLSRAAPVLSRHNCVLQVCEDTPNALDVGSPLAEARWSLLSQAKVVIILHARDQSRFDWCGAVDAIHAGAVVVTEPSSGIAPLVVGEHLVTADPDSLPYVVERLLGDEHRLARIRSAAHERLKTWVPYALSVAVLRAAVVELVGEPVPRQAAVGELRLTSEAADVVGPRAPREPRDPAPEIGLLPATAARVRLSKESPSWASRRAPRVTAVVPLPAGDGQIAATLDSLAQSTLQDFELLVVAASGGEQDRQNAEHWMSEHPRIPSRLLTADVIGVGAARNIGLDFARGAFFLMLGVGQELYPRCLDVLAGTLEEMPEVAFAYPMQEVIGAPEEFVQQRGDYLLSFVGWNPERLQLGSFVHAPALVRTDRLRQLGGFLTDPRLEGFEDYDLCCRVADWGWRGQLAPQVLARRTEWSSSPTLSAIHPSCSYVTTALVERAPTLMVGAFGGSAEGCP